MNVRSPVKVSQKWSSLFVVEKTNRKQSIVEEKIISAGVVHLGPLVTAKTFPCLGTYNPLYDRRLLSQLFIYI